VAKLLQISPLALNDIDRKVLEVAVNLLTDEGITCSLLPADVPNGHLLVINHDSEEGRKFLSEAQERQVKLLLTSEPIKGKNIVCVERPIRVAELADVLTRICLRIKVRMASMKLAGRTGDAESAPRSGSSTTKDSPPETAADTTANADAPPPAPPSAASDRDDDGPELFRKLLDAKLQQRALAVHGKNETLLLVGGHNNSVATKDQLSIQQLVQTPARDIFVENIETGEFDELSKMMTLSALDNLLWLAGVEFSHGRLLPGHDMEKPVKLKAWPNFTRNGFRHSQFKLAASMASKPVSLTELANNTGVPIEEVIDFYNAAYAVGLIDQQAAPQAGKQKQKPVPSSRRGLIGMIARKLGLG